MSEQEPPDIPEIKRLSPQIAFRLEGYVDGKYINEWTYAQFDNTVLILFDPDFGYEDMGYALFKHSSGEHVPIYSKEFIGIMVEAGFPYYMRPYPDDDDLEKFMLWNRLLLEQDLANLEIDEEE